MQSSKGPSTDLPPFQLENGMSVLVGKLISLGLDDLAIKELRILKRRLDTENAPKKAYGSNTATTSAAQNLPELLDFGNSTFTGVKLGLVITTQLQVLRLMTTSRRPKYAEAALPILSTKHPSSPTRLLLLAAKESNAVKQAEKITRQLQTLSEIMFSLSPSVSPADDSLALEERICVTPEAAIQLQTLAFHNRFLWWGIAGHKGDLSKEIFDPFLRCLSTFARRSQEDALDTYQICRLVTHDVTTLLSDCSDSPRALKSTLLGLYRLLGSLAKDASSVEDAISWTEKAQNVSDPKLDSEARNFSNIARLVSLKLRRPRIDPKDEGLLLTLLEGLERPFKGDSVEIDELLLEVSYARRAAITVLAENRAVPDLLDPINGLSDGMREMCESLVFLYPRLSLRYLGTPPDVNSVTKDIVRFEQRRLFIARPAIHGIDSSLFLIKILASAGRLSWDLVDSKLQDCLLLLNRLDCNSSEEPQIDRATPVSYHVRISNLYYTQFLNMRRNPDNPKDGQQVRALRRSIDSIRARPCHEKKAAQFSMKLERMAEFCKETCRYDELFKTLLSLRDELICDGVLSTVRENASCRPIRDAWNADDESSTLGRTVHLLLKVQLKYLSPASQISLFDSSWSNEEKGAILEHQLDLLSNQQSDSMAARNLLIKASQDLLSLYNRQQYPIRRLRVLTRLLYLDLDEGRDAREEIESELYSAKTRELVVEGTRDEGLRGYMDHFQALALTAMELRQSHPNIDVLKRGLGVWASIRTQCEDIITFERKVEDVAGLLTHLHTVSDYLQMMGFDTTRVAILKLITEIHELLINTCSPDGIVLSFSHLGAQWLQLGYSGKAGLALDRARTYNQRNGVTTYATLQLYVSHSEYLLAIGCFDKA